MFGGERDGFVCYNSIHIVAGCISGFIDRGLQLIHRGIDIVQDFFNLVLDIDLDFFHLVLEIDLDFFNLVLDIALEGFNLGLHIFIDGVRDALDFGLKIHFKIIKE